MPARLRVPSMNKPNYKRPFLKWLGNKYNCLHHILTALPNANRLIEPFAGSGAVFLNTNYPNYLIAEGNTDLIALFHYIQQEGEQFIKECEAYFCGAHNLPEIYYRLRDEFNQSTDPKYRATLFVYLNRHGYNGLCRYNQKGGYNVPFGRYEKPLFPRPQMQFFHQKSQHVTFRKGDFQETFALAQPGDLIYCDPPYAPLDQCSNFSTYTSRQFGEKEQIILAKLANESAKHGVTVVISNHDTEFTREIYQGSQIKSFLVKRVVSSDTTNRIPVRELLAVFKP